MKPNLWLASWYPNRISPLNGDFIQRHAEALSIYEPVYVIYVVKDQKGMVTRYSTVECFNRGNLTECIAYYKPYQTGIKIIDRLVSVITFINTCRRLVGVYIKKFGRPQLVHVQVALWAGIMALWLKAKYGIPYLVTEHWTGYHKNAAENINNKGILFKVLSRLVLKHAGLVLPASSELGECIHHNIVPIRFLPVSNVVNTALFNLSGFAGKEFTFIHVSSMSPQKNVKGLLKAFSEFLQTHKNCRLVMAGPATDDMIQESRERYGESTITWRGVLSYPEVATAMAASSALVMFSLYENQPCVILEALCTGLPVISTNVGGIPEVITAENGILVEPGNETQLLHAMITMIENYHRFDKFTISNNATGKYNYHAIGRIIADLYPVYRQG